MARRRWFSLRNRGGKLLLYLRAQRQLARVRRLLAIIFGQSLSSANLARGRTIPGEIKPLMRMRAHFRAPR